MGQYYAIIFYVVQFVVVAHPQQDGGGQDPCVQYQTQCVEGSNLAGQGAESGIAIFPNNPLPVDQVNMTAIQQMPYCDGLAQACRTQNGTAPGVPATPNIPEVPAVPGGQREESWTGSGFFSSLRNFFDF